MLPVRAARLWSLPVALGNQDKTPTASVHPTRFSMSFPPAAARPGALLRALAAIVALACSAAAQVTLLRDIDPSAPSVGNAAPDQLRSAGSKVFFVATGATCGTEPFVTDGTAAGTRLLGDLRPGPFGSSPSLLATWPGHALYVVRPEPGRHAFLLSDGTGPGTQVLSDLGIPDGLFYAARLANGRFVIQRAVNNVFLPGGVFVSDLTPAGTQTVWALSGFAPLLERQGLAYGFGAPSQGSGFGWGGYDLSVTDGTVAGSRTIATHVVRLGTSPQAGLAEHAGRLYFLRSLPGAVEWGSTDGTVAGTMSHGAIPGLSTWLQLSSPPVAFAGGLALLANQTLYVGDGTGGGTAPIAGLPCNSIQQLSAFLGRLYFSAAGTSVPTGFELWSSDGTANGTALVADLAPGPANGAPLELTPSPQGIWFRAAPLSGGSALYLCDGPQSVRSIGTLPAARLAPCAPFGGGLLLPMTDPVAGFELHFASPTSPPTLVADLNAPRSGQTATNAVRLRDRLYFFADDGQHGRELWVSDGTPQGTQLLDLAAGAAGTSLPGFVEPMVAFGERIAAVVYQGGPRKVLISDGTVAGSSLQLLPPSSFGYALAVRDELLFAFEGRWVVRSDGTAAGTVWLPLTAMPNIVYPATLHALPYALVIGGPGQVPYGTDTTSAPVPLTALPVSIELGVVDGRLVFADAVGVRATDGTLIGTVLVAAGQVEVAEQQHFGGMLHFVLGGSLWRTDGTAAGTAVLAPVPAGATVLQLVRTADALLARVQTAQEGAELWRFDPSLGALVPAVDLWPGPTSGVTRIDRIADGNVVLMSVANLATGGEPWISDGTVGGTYALADVNPGACGSDPVLLGIAGTEAFLMATDDQVGREPRALALAAVGAVSLQPIASGCAGSSVAPRLSASGLPRLGAVGFGYRLSDVQPATPIAFAIGDQPGYRNLAGCRVAVDGSVATIMMLADAAGRASLALPVPPAAGLLGVQLVAQGFALHVLSVSGFVGSGALLGVVGR